MARVAVKMQYLSRRASSQLPMWIEIWFGLSALICTLDVMYTMLRPLTNRGGPLACIYEPWNWYADVDIRYATYNDIVTMATGRVMVLEIVMNLVSLFLNRIGSRHTLVCAFTTNVMVLWKTIWYMVLYIRVPEGNPEFINPNAALWQVVLCFTVPNVVWIVVPSFVMARLWKDLAVHPEGHCSMIPEHVNSEPTHPSQCYPLIPTAVPEDTRTAYTLGVSQQ